MANTPEGSGAPARTPETTICQHRAPVEFGASEVIWDDAGLAGHLVAPCASCGESICWHVEEE